MYASVPPRAAQTPPPSERHARAFTGDAPWALSALPECFAQISKSTGPLNYVLAKLPAGSAMVAKPGPEELFYGDCKLQVRGETVYVERGADRLRIPPPARIYVADGYRKLALLRAADDGYELRVYETPANSGPLRI